MIWNKQTLTLILGGAQLVLSYDVRHKNNSKLLKFAYSWSMLFHDSGYCWCTAIMLILSEKEWKIMSHYSAHYELEVGR